MADSSKGKSSKTKDFTGRNVDDVERLNVSFSEMKLGKNLYVHNLHKNAHANYKAVILSFLENPTVIEAFHKLLFLTIVVSTVAFRHLESVIQQALPHLSRNSLNCPLRIPNFTPAPYI